jgi:hypothetical protein
VEDHHARRQPQVNAMDQITNRLQS